MRAVTCAVAMVVALVATHAVARADTIQIGGTTGNAMAIPFADMSGTTRYQQVYDSAGFSSPGTITSIAFFSFDDPRGSVSNYSADIEIRLSHTSKSSQGLSADLDSNVTGTEVTVLDDASFSIELVRNSWSLVFDLSTAFTFNPNDGNLLMDIRVSGQSHFVGFVSNYTSEASRAFDSPWFGNHANNAYLATQFTTTPVPEPGTLALLGLGLAALAWRRRRA